MAQLFLGNGDGTFPSDGGLINIGEATFNVAAASPTSRNGHDDLIDQRQLLNSGKVYVTLGNGDGTFQAPGVLPTRP